MTGICEEEDEDDDADGKEEEDATEQLKPVTVCIDAHCYIHFTVNCS